MLPAFSEEHKVATPFVLPPIAQVINNANQQILELSLLSCEDQTTELNIVSEDMDDLIDENYNNQLPRLPRSRSRSLESEGSF